MSIYKSKFAVPDQEFRYVCEDDRKLHEAALAEWRAGGESPDAKPEDPPHFLLRPITGRTWARIQDHLGSGAAKPGGAGNVNIGTVQIEILRHGLVGWEGMTTPDGAPLKFAKSPSDHLIAEPLLRMFRGQIISELAAAISAGNSLTAEDLGN